MPQQVTNIKKRIASIKGAYKVTSAMKLISTVKLKKWRNTMLDNKLYANELSNIIKEIFKYTEEVKNPFFEVNTKSDKNLYIIISSTLGLCGSYNNNILRLADKEITPKDDILVLGQKGMTHFEDGGNKMIKGFEEVNNHVESSFLKKLYNLVTKKYLSGVYKEIHLIYSEYINALVFKAKDSILLPIKKEEGSGLLPPLMEPSKEVLLDKLVPIYLRSNIYSKILESEVCEQASRSLKTLKNYSIN